MSEEKMITLRLTAEELETLSYIVDMFEVKDLNEVLGGFGEGWDGAGAQRGCAVADKVEACWKKHFPKGRYFNSDFCPGGESE